MSDASLLIREATAEDLSTASAIMQANPPAPQWTLEQVHAMLAAHPDGGGLQRQILVAEGNGTVLGFAVVSILTTGHATDAELESIAVMPSAQRKGIGSALLQSAIAWALQRGASRIMLEVRASNASAMSLYAKSAFRQTGIRHNYYTHPTEDAFLMERRLEET